MLDTASNSHHAKCQNLNPVHKIVMPSFQKEMMEERNEDHKIVHTRDLGLANLFTLFEVTSILTFDQNTACHLDIPLHSLKRI